MNFDLESVVLAYRSWIEAARAAAGSGTALNALIAKNLQGRRTRNIDARIRGWTNPKSLKIPNGADAHGKSEIAALALAVTTLVTEKPRYEVPLDSFIEVLDALRAKRSQNQLDGTKLKLSGERLWEQGILGVKPCLVIELDQKLVNLGSGIYHGELPKYCKRQFDERLLAALDNPEVDLITLVGVPKSGKTRSLVQKLQESKLSDCTLLWIRPNGDFEMLIRELKPANKPNTVIIIDDLQRWQRGGEALNPLLLKELRNRAKLLITIHDAALTDWQGAKFDHTSANSTDDKSRLRQSPSQYVLDEIERSAIYVESLLDGAELEDAQKNHPKHSPEDMKFVAAYFSSSDYLQTKARDMLARNEASTRAIVGAIVSARIIHPGGFTIDQLRFFAESEMQRIAPHAHFNTYRFEEIVSNELTVGSSVESPHSLLQKTPDNPKTYSLFDPVWPLFKPETWRPPNQLLEISSPEEIASQMEDEKYFAEARELLDSVSQPSGIYYYRLYARICSGLGDLDGETKSYIIGSELGDSDSMFNLGVILSEKNPVDSLRYYELAAKAGDTDAMINLALLLVDLDSDSSERWLRKAMQLGSQDAMVNLAFDLEARDVAEAKRLYLRAAKAGHARAMSKLAELQLKQGDRNSALKWLKKSASLNYLPAFGRLAESLLNNSPDESRQVLRDAINLADSSDTSVEPDQIDLLADVVSQFDLEAGLTLYKIAAQKDVTASMSSLGHLYLDQDADLSQHWLKKASERGNVSALMTLADIEHERNAIEADALRQKARELLEPRADFGSAWANTKLAELLEESDLESAKRHLVFAAEKKFPIAMTRLAMMTHTQDRDKAISLLEEAIALDHAPAMDFLGDLLEFSDPKRAKQLYANAAERNNSWAMVSLVKFLDKREEAISWLEKAISLSSLPAMRKLSKLLQGIDDDRSQALAFEAIRRGRIRAERGELGAMVDLALDIEESEPDLALGWLRKASDRQNDVAMDFLADRLLKSDADAAKELYERAAKLGNMWSMVSLGDIHVSARPDLAEGLYSDAARLGHPMAKVKLAWMLRSKNPKRAIEVFEEACDEEDDEAMDYYADWILHDDRDKALALYSRAAELGNSNSMISLGNIFRSSNRKLATHYYEKAIETQPGRAFDYLGDMFKDTNLKKAISFFSRAADNNNLPSMFSLVEIYSKAKPELAGEILLKLKTDLDSAAAKRDENFAWALAFRADLYWWENRDEAIRLYKLAAEEGDSSEKTRYADVIFSNNIQEAQQIYKLCAEEDFAPAMFRLAMHKMSTDPDLAGKMLERSAKLGYPLALDEVRRLVQSAGQESPIWIQEPLLTWTWAEEIARYASCLYPTDSSSAKQFWETSSQLGYKFSQWSEGKTKNMVANSGLTNHPKNPKAQGLSSEDANAPRDPEERRRLRPDTSSTISTAKTKGHKLQK